MLTTRRNAARNNNDIRPNAWMSRVKRNKWFKVLAIWFTIAGMLSFGLFILEEGFQTAMFSTWPASDVQDWDAVAMATRFQSKIIKSLEIGSWITVPFNPVAAYCYYQYAQSGKLYIYSKRSQVLRFKPSALIGDMIDIHFKIERVNTKIDNNGKKIRFTRYHGITVLIGSGVECGDQVNWHGILPDDLTVTDRRPN